MKPWSTVFSLPHARLWILNPRNSGIVNTPIQRNVSCSNRLSNADHSKGGTSALSRSGRGLPGWPPSVSKKSRLPMTRNKAFLTICYALSSLWRTSSFNPHVSLSRLVSRLWLNWNWGKRGVDKRDYMSDGNNSGIVVQWGRFESHCAPKSKLAWVVQT